MVVIYFIFHAQSDKLLFFFCFFSVGKETLSADNADIEDYELQTRNALMGELVSGFEYELKEAADKDDKSLQLIWKKVVEKDHIKVRVSPCLILHFCFSIHLNNLSCAFSSFLEMSY